MDDLRRARAAVVDKKLVELVRQVGHSYGEVEAAGEHRKTQVSAASVAIGSAARHMPAMIPE